VEDPHGSSSPVQKCASSTKAISTVPHHLNRASKLAFVEAAHVSCPSSTFRPRKIVAMTMPTTDLPHTETVLRETKPRAPSSDHRVSIVVVILPVYQIGLIDCPTSSHLPLVIQPSSTVQACGPDQVFVPSGKHLSLYVWIILPFLRTSLPHLLTTVAVGLRLFKSPPIQRLMASVLPLSALRHVIYLLLIVLEFSLSAATHPYQGLRPFARPRTLLFRPLLQSKLLLPPKSTSKHTLGR
jgi:hypothetical protein